VFFVECPCLVLEKLYTFGSDKIANILYGLSTFSASLRKKIEDHKIVLGGCCVSGNDPTWVCIACNTKIYRMMIDFDDFIS